MRRSTGIAVFVTTAGMAGALAASPGAQASVAKPGFGFGAGTRLIPGDLLVSTSHYVNDPNIVAGQTILPPGAGVTAAYYRAVATLSSGGRWTFTETNAYSGNNGRAAVEAKVDGKYFIYTAGNAGNGANPQPPGVVLGAGAQTTATLSTGVRPACIGPAVPCRASG